MPRENAAARAKRLCGTLRNSYRGSGARGGDNLRVGFIGHLSRVRARRPAIGDFPRGGGAA
jgi:hypothetical protein